MSLNLSSLASQPRLLLEVPLKPLQGSRFQPTGFPDLGAATYEHNQESMLLVESAQSMANRLESVCWDEASDDLVVSLQGLPYVKSVLPDGTTTSSILEAHRINSPYIVKSKGFEAIQADVGFEPNKPFNRNKLVLALLKYDPSSLLHGIFLEKIGGVVRLPRVISSFIEASKVNVVANGGVKVDRIQPSSSGDSTAYGKAKDGYGNVPYHRDEYVAENITALLKLDLAQLRDALLALDVLSGVQIVAGGNVISEGRECREGCSEINDIVANNSAPGVTALVFERQKLHLVS